MAFALAAAGYVTLFHLIEHRRPKYGPWVVRFDTQTNGAVRLLIDQPKLGITNVELRMTLRNHPATNYSQIVRFDKARQVPFDVPFGQCIFLETTFLPGTVTLRMEGHEIELLPKALVVDRLRYAWEANKVVEVRNAQETP